MHNDEIYELRQKEKAKKAKETLKFKLDFLYERLKSKGYFTETTSQTTMHGTIRTASFLTADVLEILENKGYQIDHSSETDFIVENKTIKEGFIFKKQKTIKVKKDRINHIITVSIVEPKKIAKKPITMWD